MKWQDAKLNTSGDELIYETEGDAERGNPLDIISVVKVSGGTDVLEFKFPVKKMTKELARRWNGFQILVDALREIESETARPVTGEGMDANHVAATIRKAFKEAKVDL